MKKELIFGIIGSLLAIGLVFAIRTTYYTNIAPLATGTNILSNGNAEDALQTAAASGATTLDINLVSLHNTLEDCWLVINDGVYDVSTYLKLHPGGQAIVLPYCGKDATTAFSTKAGEGSHSSFAKEQLASYRIGNLNMPLTDVLPVQGIEDSLSNNSIQTNTSITNSNSTSSSSITLDTATISRHDTSSDCWIIINGTVYSVSGYLSAHPGGAAIIIPYCGKDATTAFTTQAGQGSHSSAAYNQLAGYAIGTVGSTTTTENIQTTQTEINNMPAPSASDEDEEEDEHEDEEEDDD